MAVIWKDLPLLQGDQVHRPNPSKQFQERLIKRSYLHQRYSQANLQDIKLWVDILQVGQQLYENTPCGHSAIDIITDKLNYDQKAVNCGVQQLPCIEPFLKEEGVDNKDALLSGDKDRRRRGLQRLLDH